MAAQPTCRATLSGHKDWVRAAAFSPDGRSVVTGCEDGTAKLWDVASGACRATLVGHHSNVTAAAFSPDGKMVVTGSGDVTAKLWDADSGVCRATLHEHTNDVYAAAFSPDGKTVVTGSCDKTAKLWDVDSGACRATLIGHSAYVNGVAFSPDCKTVVTASGDTTVKLWDVASGACRATLTGHSAHVNAAAFSPDGKTVVSGGSYDKTAKLWDASSGACRVTLKGHSAPVFAAAFSPDGNTVVTASGDNTAKLWDVASGACRATLSGHNAAVFAAAFTSDGKMVVTGSGDCTVKLWDTSFYASSPAAAAPAADVPSDVASLLSQLSLSSYGAALVSQLGVTSVADLRLLTEAHLKDDLPDMKVAERLRLINAVAKSGPVTAPAPVSSRVRIRALCIGIDAYGSPLRTLDNAVADATAVHAALSALPGAASTLVTNCTKAALEAALVAFRDGTGLCLGRGMRVDAAPAASGSPGGERTLGVVFFAGHGLQVSGRNYLVPSDFRPPNKNDKLEPMLRDTARACVCLDLVEEILQDAGVTAGAVLLDCCRNVPDFLAQLGATRSAGATRALPAGMSDAKPSLKDLMVTFATAPGTEARDRSSRLPGHSPFTAALLKAFEAPKRLVDLSPFLTDEVAADSGGEQRPHVGGSYGIEAGNLMLG